MTRTEDRLADALGAGAELIRPESLRPLADTLSAALGAKGFSGTTVASASQASVFAVAYVASGNWFDIDEFGLTKTGHINHLSQVGKVREFVNVSLAMSPDGSKIAFAGLSLQGSTSGHQVIEVFDRLTGSHSIWTSGTTSGSSQLAIAALSWQATGRSLIYQGDWCSPDGLAVLNAYCFSAGGNSAKAPFIKQLSVVGNRGLLPGGEIGGKLMRTFGSVGKAQSLKVIADPADSRAVLFMEQSNGRVLIYKVNAQGKFDPRLLFRSKAEPALRQGDSASFYADGSGSYLLVNVNKGALYGWVHAGQFHRLDANKVDWQSGAW